MSEDLELAIETGKVAFVPSKKPAEGPMGEYCVHMQPPKGTYPLWVAAVKRRTKKGIRYRVNRIFLPFDGCRPEGATDKVADIVCDATWLLIGDLIFLHDRDPRGSERSDCAYNRAMSAIRKGANLGGLYFASSGYGVAVRVALKEARLPIVTRIENGRPCSVVVDVDPESSLPKF